MRYFVLFLVFSIFAACGTLHPGSNLTTKHYFRYGIESGHVVYAISGIKKGTEELFFEQYGLLQAKYTSNRVKLGAEEREMRTATITKIDSVFLLNLNDFTGRVFYDRILFDLADSLKIRDLGAAEIYMQSSESGMKYVGNKKWLQKDCRVYQLPDSSFRIWMWQNIPLRVESEILGVKNVVEAVRIQTELAIPKSKFEIPKGMKIERE